MKMESFTETLTLSAPTIHPLTKAVMDVRSLRGLTDI